MKRTQKSVRKIKLLLMLMLITMILAITATYAWFSSQREVEISGIKLNVEVAESMQISLDGEHWMQSITIDNMRQFYGTYSDTSTHQANDEDNTNYVPTELKPVSTIGEVSSGKMQFMTGEAEMSGTTTSVTAEPCSEADLVKTSTVDTREDGNDSHPYLVFDMYLRNYSAKTSDNLQLNKDSIVWVDSTTASSQEGTGKEGTGLENCIRVGFVVYENTADATASASIVRGLTSSGTSAQVVIWEPNDLEHIQEVIDNSGRGVQANTTMPTYGIKYSSSAVTLTDVEDTDTTTNTKIAQQVTMKPAYGTTGTTNPTNMTDTSNTEIMLAGNKITKIRVYIWIEGQDVDCINTASQGDRLQANLKLTKPENNEGIENTYLGDGTETGLIPGTILTAAKLNATPSAAITEYGAYVTNYTPTNGENVEWRIFHSDGENIYLIANDYVGSQYFSNYSESDYSGTDDIESNLKTKLLSQFASYTNTRNAAKMTAFLLDTEVWSGFKDSTEYAEYAIGAPTLELFAASYNATHSTHIDTRVTECSMYGGYGYEVKLNTEEEWKYELLMSMLKEGITEDDILAELMQIEGIDEMSEEEIIDVLSDLGIIESLYWGKNNESLYIYFLASPSAYEDVTDSNAPTIYGVGADYSSQAGALASMSLLQSSVLRPVVALKSDVKIEKQEDGTYLIVE